MDESVTGCGAQHPTNPKCKLSVELERSEEVYYGGQFLKGAVKVELENSLEITGLKLRIFGGSCIQWTLKKPKQTRRNNEWFREEEVYFDESFVLWGQGSPGDHVHPNVLGIDQLSKVRHIFPFNWLIPTDLPSSFEGSMGWVRYFAQCMLLTPGCRNTCQTSFVRTKYFTVLRHLDLNSKSIFKEPCKVSKEINLSSHSCKGGNITVAMGTPRAGYVCGENINVDVDINNSSSKKVKNTLLTLRQIIKYGATDDSDESRVEYVVLGQISGDSVKAQKQQCWTCKGIEIPPVIPSDMNKCSIIDVKYDIKLSVKTSQQCLTIKLPIFIGTIPAKDSYLTTWTYKETKPIVRENSKSRKLMRMDMGHSGRGVVETPLTADGTIFWPKFRYYHQVTPRLKTKIILPMEASPGQRRRRRSMYVCRTIRLKSHQWENMESTV